MIYKFIKAFIAFFMLAGATSSALLGKNPETLNEMEVRGSNHFEDLDLSRSSVLSGNYIEKNKAGSISDLSGLAPNLYINSFGIQSYGDVITLRGIGNAQFFGDQVQLYVDGIPHGNVFLFLRSFRFRKHRSTQRPQGRFGKKLAPGVMNVKSRKTGETHRSKFSASYATFNTQNYRVLADGPMDDNFPTH